MFCIMLGIRCQQFSWCWKRSFVLTYFQDHYVEESSDEQCDFYVGLDIVQKLPQWLEFVLAVREMSGKSQGIFLWQPSGNGLKLQPTD